MKFPSLKLDEDALKITCEHPSKCEHAESSIRKKSDKNGRPLIYKQCHSCGQKVGGRLSVKDYTQPEIESFAEYDDEFQNTVWKRFYVRHTEARNLLVSSLKAEWKRTYDEYLASPEWMEKRSLVMMRAQGICEGCRKRRAAEVHHHTYQNVGEEFLFQLVALCRDCHGRFHSSIQPRLFEDLFVRIYDGAASYEENNENTK